MANRTLELISGSKELANVVSNRRIDTRGLVCPYPSFETAKLAQSAAEREVVEILSDDEYTALNSIPTVLKQRDFECSVVKTNDGYWAVKARRKL
jgi:TusA-related sulfurtransferase